MKLIQRTGDVLTRVVDVINAMINQGLFHSGAEREVTVSGADLDVEINHGLDRIPNRIVTLRVSAGEVWFEGTPHSDPKRFINVRATGACTARLLII